MGSKIIKVEHCKDCPYVWVEKHRYTSDGSHYLECGKNGKFLFIGLIGGSPDYYKPEKRYKRYKRIPKWCPLEELNSK